MASKMLIDAAHPEETRVVVVDGSRVEEFDYETVTKAQISGNIYLARVTRVEPSLQAAFVEYGGGRHGFLAFSEIHPDYYQIPVADREALLEAERRAAEAEEAREEEIARRKSSRKDRRGDGGDEQSEDRRNRRRGRSRDRDNREKGPDKHRLRTQPFGDAEASTDGAEIVQSTETSDAFWLNPAPVPALGASKPAQAESASDDAEGAPIDSASAEAADAPRPSTQPERAATPSETISEPAPATASAETARSEDVWGAAADHEDRRLDSDAASDDERAAGFDDALEADLGAGSRARDGFEESDIDEPASDDHALDAPSAEEHEVEEIGPDDAREELKPRVLRARDYKIQEVIKRKQIVLVQVVKEERGTKGAALTTFLSLAGRYCVLMPNTPRGGGISRKITSAADRKRLKALASEFEVPEGMGLIVRTAGANRTKSEIKRDYEYLLRQYSAIRDLTLRSIAPALIYEEGSLVKRAIRDLYNKDISTVLVDGEDAYREAKDYMKMLMPSHAKNVQPYRETTPLFIKHQIESQVSSMHEPRVQLRSGGYLIINVTEALVAVDVNSGKSTKEGSIEDTALKTNLEAAEELARQMKLRDLAGLIVIDFIDMEEPRNNRAVEKRLKDKLKNDRARIQIGRISGFGLLEMSRQRLRPGLLEATTQQCSMCGGAGVVRSDESMALTILRAIEEESVRGRSAAVRVSAPTSAANYILNFKRARIGEIEARYAIQVFIEGDPALPRTEYKLERVKPVQREAEHPRRAVVQIDGGYSVDDGAQDDGDDERETVEAVADEAERPTRRRNRGANDESNGGRRRSEEPLEADAVEEEQAERSAFDESDDDEDGGGKKRRRGRRGGRRRKRREDEARNGADPMPVFDLSEGEEAEEPTPPVESGADAEASADAEAISQDAVRQDALPDQVAWEGSAVAEEAPQIQDRMDAHAAAAALEEERVATDRGRTTPSDDAPVRAEASEETRVLEFADSHEGGESNGAAPVPQMAESPEEPSKVVIVSSAARKDNSEGPPRTGWWALRRNI